MNTTDMLLHQSYVHVGGTQEMGRLVTGSLQAIDTEPDCNGSDEYGSWGGRHLRSRRISQAKAQKQELVVCRDWQTGWVG